MNLNDIDCSQVMNRINDTVDEMQDRVSSKIIAEQEYKTQLESCIFETRDILHKMQEDSEKESKTNFRRFLINTIIAVATLIVSVIAATVSVIQIL